MLALLMGLAMAYLPLIVIMVKDYHGHEFSH